MLREKQEGKEETKEEGGEERTEGKSFILDSLLKCLDTLGWSRSKPEAWSPSQVLLQVAGIQELEPWSVVSQGGHQLVAGGGVE